MIIILFISVILLLLYYSTETVESQYYLKEYDYKNLTLRRLYCIIKYHYLKPRPRKERLDGEQDESNGHFCLYGLQRRRYEGKTAQRGLQIPSQND